MKVANFVLKVVAVTLIAAATVCAVVAFQDKLVAFGKSLYSKVRAACELGRDDFSDYAE